MFWVYIGRLIKYDFESVTLDVVMHTKGVRPAKHMHSQLCIMQDMQHRNYAGAMSYKNDHKVNCIQNWKLDEMCILIRRGGDVGYMFDTVENFNKKSSMSDIVFEGGKSYASILYDGTSIELEGTAEAVRLL